MHDSTKASEKRDIQSLADTARVPMLKIEVVELADPDESAADVVFYRTTCCTCSTS